METPKPLPARERFAIRSIQRTHNDYTPDAREVYRMYRHGASWETLCTYYDRYLEPNFRKGLKAMQSAHTSINETFIRASNESEYQKLIRKGEEAIQSGVIKSHYPHEDTVIIDEAHIYDGKLDALEGRR